MKYQQWLAASANIAGWRSEKAGENAKRKHRKRHGGGNGSVAKAQSGGTGEKPAAASGIISEMAKKCEN
jgi:hypothetical protein